MGSSASGPTPIVGLLASLRSPPVTRKVTSAVGRSCTVTGQVTRTRPLAGTVTVCSASPSIVRPVASKLTVASMAASVLLLTLAPSDRLSPTVKKRGVIGRMMSGRRARMSASPCPTRVSVVAALLCIRQVVTLSGSGTSTEARPSASVSSLASQ